MSKKSDILLITTHELLCVMLGGVKMTFSDYKKIIDKVTFDNADFNKLEILVEEMAYNENLTRDEYSELYKMLIDKFRF